MNEYATFFIETKDGPEDKEELEKLKKNYKNVVSVRVVEKNPVLDEIKATVSGTHQAIIQPDFIVEVKLGEKIDLSQIKKKLGEFAKIVVATEPYRYILTS